ncbi:hypothetical protein ACNTMW_20370 [Planosporangium sp. 12N6]|uniref:hypothetical protein n=1 Tax=Planosporangium spinosum TaxID=3402278 RepID=UPI003CEB2B8B
MTDEASESQRHLGGPGAGPGGPAPATLRAAVGLLLAEAAVVALIVVFLAYKDFTARDVVVRDAAIVTGFAAMVAVVLGVFGVALNRRRGWARGPAVVMELMLLPIGWYMVSGGMAWLGVPVLLLGLVGAGLLIAPATREALGLR